VIDGDNRLLGLRTTEQTNEQQRQQPRSSRHQHTPPCSAIQLI
jgi:hypothetical protein